MTIVVVGDVINDVVVKPLHEVTRDSDTTSIVSLTSGGSGANLAAWLGSLGVPVRFAARAGETDAARHARALSLLGVDARISTAPGEETGTIVVMLEPDGSRTMFTDRGASGRLGEVDLPPSLLEDANWLHLSGYCLFPPAGREACLRLFEAAGRAGIKRSVDPNSLTGLSEVGPASFLAWTDGADVVFPNLAEARALTGCTTADEAAERLLSHFGLVALKLGPDGALVRGRDGGCLRTPAPPTSARDPTGAGDAFAAGFLAVLASGGHIENAMDTALETAARAITRVGGWPPTS